jgi:RNA polymerase sigma-70 factor (ECF subfamily)
MTDAPLDIGQIYRQHAPAVYRRIRRFYREQEAEEVLHEVFLVLLERVEQFRGDASPSTWLYRIATNHCLNRLRNQQRRDALWLESSEDLWYQRHAGADQEAALTLRQVWKELPAELVSVGVYYYVDGMTHGEIARVLGVSRRTIGNRLTELERVAKEAST